MEKKTREKYSRRRLFFLRFMNMNIRGKLAVLLMICVAVFLFLFASTTYMARKTMLKVSKDSIQNLSAQLMDNLDNKVYAIETATYDIKDSWKRLELYSVTPEIDNYSYTVKNQNFCDVIISSYQLYDNVDAVIFQNMNGVSFNYKKDYVYSDNETEDTLDSLKKLVSTEQPFIWTKVNGKVVFVRCIVNETTLAAEGYLMLYVNQEFFHFIEMENQLLLNENMIIIDRKKKVLRNDSFKTEDEAIQKLLKEPDTGDTTSQMLKYAGQEYLAVATDSQKTGWKTLILVPIWKLIQQQNEFVSMSFVLALLLLLVMLFLSYLIMKSITNNISILMDGMERFEKEGKYFRLKPYNYDEIGQLINRFNYMTMKIEKLNDSVINERSKKEKAEFQAMRAKINPHFLYNTLGSIKWISHKNGEKYIEGMLDSLIYLMRSSIKNTDTFITVKEELSYIENYLKLQEMRFGKVYTVIFDVDEKVLDKKILGFLLQPIVENSLYHGIDMEKENGIITITAQAAEGMVCLGVRDNGIGMSEDEVVRIMTDEKEYTGFNSIGIQIIASRLQAYYHENYKFEIKSEIGKGTAVTIKIPYGGEYVEGAVS